MTAAEQPDELLDDDAAPGTPVQQQVAAQAAPLWCAHGTRWTATDAGYVADDALSSKHLGHRDPAQDAGAIPCQPTYASFEVWERTALARELMPDDEGMI